MHGKVIHACDLFIREASNRLSQWEFKCARQAINLYAERPYLQPGLPEARDFAQATEHSKQLTNAFRSDIQKYWDELENARRKLQVSSPLTSQLHSLCNTDLLATQCACTHACKTHTMLQDDAMENL